MWLPVAMSHARTASGPIGSPIRPIRRARHRRSSPPRAWLYRDGPATSDRTRPSPRRRSTAAAEEHGSDRGRGELGQNRGEGAVEQHEVCRCPRADPARWAAGVLGCGEERVESGSRGKSFGRAQAGAAGGLAVGGGGDHGPRIDGAVGGVGGQRQRRRGGRSGNAADAGGSTGAAATPTSTARSASSAPWRARSQAATAGHGSPVSSAPTSAPSSSGSSGRAQDTAAQPSAVGSSRPAGPRTPRRDGCGR
jgi:hypothetical protein